MLYQPADERDGLLGITYSLLVLPAGRGVLGGVTAGGGM